MIRRPPRSTLFPYAARFRSFGCRRDGSGRRKAVCRSEARRGLGTSRVTHYGQRRPMIRSFMSSLNTLLAEDDDPTAGEYAVMLALIIAVCIVAIRAAGTQAN